MTTVSEIGEFGLIARLAKQVADARLDPPAVEGFDLRLGIGADAAAWRPGGGIEVATTDTVVEGAHFTRETIPWADLGWKVWAANLSDIAAMGAVPTVGMVTLGLPSDLPVDAVDELYVGMLEACRCYRTLIVGGDIVGARDVFVTVGMNGACAGEPLRRDAARPGDAIAVSGALGGSAGGLRALRQGGEVTESARSLVRAHRRPEPRIETGQTLLREGVRCAMDLSDGLTADLGKLCAASGTAATIDAEKVPVAQALREVFPEDALQLALGGGEDYELLFTGPLPLIERLVGGLPAAAVIGEVTAGEAGRVVVVDESGAEMQLSEAGWEHLR